MSDELKANYISSFAIESEWKAGDMVTYYCKRHAKWLRGEVCEEIDEDGHYKVPKFFFQTRINFFLIGVCLRYCGK